MNCLIIGFGEIGQGVYGAFSDYHKLDYIDLIKGAMTTEQEYDLLLVCIPYSERFICYVREYQVVYKPKGTIIFSTVPIGTTRQIPNAVHSPIEGKHPDLAKSIKKWDVYLGGRNETAERFYQDMNKIWHIVEPEWSEALKLLSTTNYGINIEYARYCNKLCEKINMPYWFVKRWNESYNKLYEGEYCRTILDPPDGKIGGHCILNNNKLLRQCLDDKLLQILEENNE